MRSKSKLRVAFDVVLRVLLVTVIFTLLGFAVGLFCGIGAGTLYGIIRHIRPDMTMAYRLVAIPFACFAFVITFLVMLFTEIRRLRGSHELPPNSALPRTS